MVDAVLVGEAVQEAGEAVGWRDQGGGVSDEYSALGSQHRTSNYDSHRRMKDANMGICAFKGWALTEHLTR